MLQQHLDNPEQAARYLTACHEEGPEIFLQGLRDTVEARGGMSRVACLAGINRERLSWQLTCRGNPRISSLIRVLSALGIKLRFAAS